MQQERYTVSFTFVCIESQSMSVLPFLDSLLKPVCKCRYHLVEVKVDGPHDPKLLIFHHFSF